MNILIVDDHEVNRYLLESMLNGSGHDVRSATNGAKAFEIITDGGIELIISDILMPVMDGFQLCRKVKADARFRRIPFIIYTATYTGPQDEAFAMTIGADRFIQKPCEPDIFMGIVETLIAAGPHHQPLTQPEQASEEEILKLYSERLVRKLEKKMVELEEELEKRKEVEETLRRITASVQDAIVMMDDQGKVSFWNQSAERVFGYSQQEIIGSDLHLALTPSRFHKAYHHRFPGFRETGEGPAVDKITELAGKKKDGTEFPAELSLSGVKIHGKWHAIGLVRDISTKKNIEIQQKNLEKQLQQAQKMEAIGTLAGGIAHDFNNILTAIIGYTELTLDKVEKDSVIEDYLHEVFSAGKRAKDLVNQILAVAREANEEVKPIPLHPIVKEVLKLIRSSIPATIEVKPAVESDSLIMGNATRIHQILMNLCTNAAHAMQEKGGILEVGLRDVTIANKASASALALKPGDYIELTVSDTGTGIPPDIIGFIFEPYFTTKASGEGTGLGLSVVHGIVESYGGKIGADSELGKGSAFTIYLPITKKIHKAGQPREIAELPSGTERILFLDDEASIANLGCQILSGIGYSVTQRTSSVEALALFRSKPNAFDLVITDMTMPNMTGDKLAVELMKVRSDIPIILCTGYSNRISDQTANALGIKALVHKPIVKADLSKIVRNVLDRHNRFTRPGEILKMEGRDT
ncbi:response regulator [Desulfosarcina ovata]|uniref:histidine kinase n=1 Tax=Desulfosarcina ovata subsp. ovata TaxID=2752305 RepID=A0A5K8AEU3_9BACT|nr:response regulator [Desulfosarcina ovata]BBO91091.1 hypothetical protein DSCOOX_42710 [Desulfosarcina ovata subsp. ovata]